MKHEQNIIVALRVRPLNRKELKDGARPIARTVDKNLVVLMDPNRDSDDILRAKRSHEHHYTFDVSFSPRATQDEVYQKTSEGLVRKVISGYNATVFAYGATGAGKTYTMLGRAEEPGVMMLTLNDLFTAMKKNEEESEYSVKMAYLEIYNETIRDLLMPSSDILDLREDARGATVVHGLRELTVSTTQEVMALLVKGNLRRSCEPTAVNRTSSRSHAILKVTVKQRSRALNIHQRVRTGMLFMVDLAGSERAANTQNRGIRMKEGAHINRSLLALANCINTLCSQGGGVGGGGGGGGVGSHYVNYRDSKLTRLLKDALSGNCQTVMIAHISPASTCFEESKNTLKYADRAKHLKTKVCSNVSDVTHHITQYVNIIASLHRRINELERQKKEGWRRKGEGGGEGERMCSELKALLLEEKEIRQEMVSIEYHLLLSAVESQRHLHTLREWEERHSFPPSSSSLPPPSSSTFPPHSPLPTTQEDTEQVTSSGVMSSLMFQRSSNELAASDHVTSKDHNTNGAPHGSYLTTTTAAVSHDTHMTTAVGSHDTHMTTAGGSHDSHITKRQLFSPESGAPSLEPEEPGEVSTAREELAALVGDKQRMEARHRRLVRRLMELRASHTDLQEKVSQHSLHPVQRELVESLQHCREVEEVSRERQLAAAMAGVQLGRRETTLENLLEVSRQLVEALEQCRAVMEERSTPPPSLPLLRLLERHRSLSQQARAERQLPVVGRGLQLPTIARLSARLYTTMTGSKSNLLIDDATTDGEAEEEAEEAEEKEEAEEEEEGKAKPAASPLNISDVHLPSLSGSPLPLQSSPHLPVTSSLSFPPLPHTTSVVTQPLETSQPNSNGTLFPNHSVPAVPLASTQPDTPHQDTPTKTPKQSPPTKSSKQSTPSQTATPADNPRVEAPIVSSKRTSARALLSKVGIVPPRISVSRCSSTKSKYVVHPDLLKRLQLEGSDFISSDLLTPSVSRETGEPVAMAATRTLPNSITSHPRGGKGERAVHNKAFDGPPRAHLLRPRPSQKGRGTELRLEELESFSQVSLSRKTPVRRAGEGRKERGKGRHKAHSSVPVVKSVEQRERRVPGHTARKPPPPLPVIPKRRGVRRQPLIMSKVVAGDHAVSMASPYLSSSTMQKAGSKQVAVRKTHPAHPLPKIGKSPYSHSMARSNRAKK